MNKDFIITKLNRVILVGKNEYSEKKYLLPVTYIAMN